MHPTLAGALIPHLVGDDCFIERFPNNNLDDYVDTSGSGFSAFSTSPATPHYNGIDLAVNTSALTFGITRSFGPKVAREVRFWMRLNSMAPPVNEDAGLLQLSGGATFDFTAARESSFDASQRPRLFLFGESLPVAPAQLTLAAWYQVIIVKSATPGSTTCVVKDAGGSIVQTTPFTLGHAPDAVSGLSFTVLGNVIGFPSGAVTYADIHVCS